jgi:hypothetical protein
MYLTDEDETERGRKLFNQEKEKVETSTDAFIRD